MILLWDSIFKRESCLTNNIKHMVKFYLATPRRERSAIIISVAFRGKQYKRTTKESTLVRFWNPDRQKVRVCRENRSANQVNDMLSRWQNAASKALLRFKQVSDIPSLVDFFAVVDDEFYSENGFVSPMVQEPEEICFFTDYMRQYIERYRNVRSEITVKHYQTVLNKLIAFEKRICRRLTFTDIDINFYNQFRMWIYDQGYSDNYFGSQVKVIKQIYREARDVDHLHDLNGTAHKAFITVTKEADPIFLTVDELLRLHQLDLTEKLIVDEWPDLRGKSAIKRRIITCELVKNRFLIGAFSGLRVSDFSRLGEMNIIENRIVLRTKKTDTQIVVPIHPVIRDILKSGFNLSQTISDQKMNTYIKVLAKMAKIDGKVVIREHRGGVVHERCAEKYNMVSTHTARRSFATNLLKAKDVPLAVISKALGHSKITTTMRYLRVGAEENAALLAESSYYALGTAGDRGEK